jgi:DNA polymerase
MRDKLGDRRILAIDIETYSPVELSETGVYPYAEHPDFEILLFGYAVNDRPVRVVDLKRGERLPAELYAALTDKDVLKTAWNAQFECVCIAQAFGLQLPPEQWECTMTRAAMLGLPLSLAQASQVLHPGEEKMREGRALLRYFCMPCKPTKVNGQRTRNLPEHDLTKWEMFKRYCGQDVATERAIREKLSFFDIPEKEKKLYALDRQINDRGIHVDMDLVEQAIAIHEAHCAKLTKEATALTGLSNPNSVAQLKTWLRENALETESLTKTALEELKSIAPSGAVRRMLELRQELGKTSVKKYMAMRKTLRRNARASGLMQYYGANRTGRWAGRLVQVQNLPQNHLPDLNAARETVKWGDPELLELMYGDVPDTLSQLIRTAFTAAPGHMLTVADFSAIEARVVSWFANERWRMEVFAGDGNIYEMSAARMFGVPVSSITKGSELRQKGKIAELACGYQGGVGALKSMGADKMGLSEEEMAQVITKWRATNPAIVRLWTSLERSARTAIWEQTSTWVNRNVRLRGMRNSLYITLPSGRDLVYLNVRTGENRFGGTSILYDGLNQTTRKWETLETYGGKLTENIVQAIARDCLAEAMLRLDAAGYKIVMHVHDEVVIEHDADTDCTAAVCDIMGAPLPWAPELVLRAEGYRTEYYRK